MLKTLTIAELINFKTYLRETTLETVRYTADISCLSPLYVFINLLSVIYCLPVASL